MKLAREPIAGVAATEVAATVAVTAVVVVMVVVAAAVEAVIVTAIVVAAAAATTANHAGNKQGKRKKLKGKSAVGTESINLYDCLFLLNRRCAVLPSFAFLLLPFYFLASGLIFNVIRCPLRISSTSYSSPALSSPSAYV